ncbi:MAG: hypothetical protein IPJ80_11355 [Saprospiraceae bacterium]|nr:hypothetical protein [Saprospiraceae bacterium]
MKRILLSFILFILLFSQVSFSQPGPAKNGLTAKAVLFNYQAPHRDNKQIFENLSNGIELGYTRELSNGLSFALPLRIGLANFPIYDELSKSVNTYTRDKIYTGLDALLQLNFYKNCGISPFVYAGIGGAVPALDFDNFYAQAPFGAGLDIRVNDRLKLPCNRITDLLLKTALTTGNTRLEFVWYLLQKIVMMMDGQIE